MACSVPAKIYFDRLFLISVFQYSFLHSCLLYKDLVLEAHSQVLKSVAFSFIFKSHCISFSCGRIYVRHIKKSD